MLCVVQTSVPRVRAADDKRTEHDIHVQRMRRDMTITDDTVWHDMVGHEHDMSCAATDR